VNHPDFASYDLSGIKVAASGAAPLARSVLDRMLEAFPEGVVQEGYGLTECTMGATANPPFRDQIRLGSVGLPVFDTDVKVVDVATGEDLPPGAEGEICIKGPYTGDIGREDEDGFIYITDRKKDMIIYKGYNVYPRQIEEVLFQHPAVQQCAVVGKPDPEGGEIPVAFVELKQGEKISEEALMEHVNSQVAYYKKVRRVIFMDAIPVSAAGKVLKKELRNQLMEE